MRLPEAQTAALAAAQFSLMWDIEIQKWTMPTHLYGYRVENVILTKRDGTHHATFNCDTPEGLLVCAAYERLVMAFYDDSEETAKREEMFIAAVMAGLHAGSVNDRALVLTGNVVDGLTMTGPFADTESAVRWVEDNKVDEYVVAPLKHPEA